MSGKIPAPDKTKEVLSSHVKEGIFIGKRISFWRGKAQFTCGSNQKLTFQPSKVLSKYDSETARIKFQLRRLFFFYTFSTKYGTFVPKQNIQVFWTKIEDLKQRHHKLCEDICSDYEYVEKELKRRFIEIAKFKWSNDLFYPGDPPESFVNDLVTRYMKSYTKECVVKKFKFDIFPTNPIFNEENSVYGLKEQMIKVNSDVVSSLYNSIITKRCTFIKLISTYRKKITDGRHPYKAIVTFCQLFKYSIFYDDSLLLEKIHSLRAEAMNSLSRNQDDIVSRIDDIIECIIKNDSYLVGLIYERKIQRYNSL